MSAAAPDSASAARPRGGGDPDRWKMVGAKIAFAAVLFFTWWAATAWFVPKTRAHLYPGPPEVWASFTEMAVPPAPVSGAARPTGLWAVTVDVATRSVLVQGIFHSMRRMAVGYSVSVVFGIALGIMAARSRLFKETVGSLILALQSLPSVCWLPFALLWIGLDERAILAVVILGALFSISIATENAIRNVPPIYPKVGRVLGARGVTFAKDILFFAALPELVGGLKLGWTFAWRSLMAGELIQTVPGVGHMLEVSRGLNDVPAMIVTIFTILGIGLAVDGLVFGTLERKIRRRYGLEKT